MAALLGQRLGEMHCVLARPSDDAAFTPEQADDDTARKFAEQTQRQLTAAYTVIEQQPDLSTDSAEWAKQLMQAPGGWHGVSLARR